MLEIRSNGTHYRIIQDEKTQQLRVQKKQKGDWRFDNSFQGSNLEELVNQIEEIT